MNSVSCLQYAMHIISLIHVVFPNNKVLHMMCTLYLHLNVDFFLSHIIHNNIKYYPHVLFQFISKDPKYSMSLLLNYIIYGIQCHTPYLQRV